MATLVDQLDKLMEITAWEMVTPKAYGPFHLLFMLFGFTLCVLLAWKLRHATEKTGRVLIFCIGVFLAVCELYKQLFYALYLSDNSYVWWIFPFQLCSVPMYLCLIAPLLKKGPVQQGMYSFMSIYNLLGGAIAFIEPSGLTHPYWTLTLHAFTWHMLLVFIGLFLTFSGKGGHTLRDYRRATITFLCMCVVAFAINLCFWKVSDGTINMFFLGPKDSSLIVFSYIAKRFGWYFSTALYIPAVCFGAYLCFLPNYLIHKRTATKEAAVK